jgi:hypothetical protein
MANTTNFGWETPDDTDLVKDGAAAMRTLGNAIDTSFVDLKGGTTGQVLAKNSNTDLDFTWTNGGDITEVVAGTGMSGGGSSGSVTLTNTVATAFDAAGDIVYGTGADTFTKLSLGTAGQVLKVNSGATAPEWGSAAAAFVGYSGYNSAGITANNNTYTEYTMNTEQWDTDGFHSTSTNTGRITVPSGKNGKYLITVQSAFGSSTATSTHRAVVYKNGNQDRFYSARGDGGSLEAPTISVVMDLVATDYIQVYFWQNTGGSVTMGNDVRIQMTYLGA